MQRVNPENERIKRQYFQTLKEAKGYSPATVDNASKAIAIYEESTGSIDFKHYNLHRAVEFKKFLDMREYRGRPITSRTKITYLNIVRTFFEWLSNKPGFRRSISKDDVEYLTPDRKTVRTALDSSGREYPSLDHILALTNSISIRTEIDVRDRALIAFTLLSGMRDMAIATLPFGCLDIRTLRVNQSPKKGVKTKFSKANHSTLFVFSDQLLEYLQEWCGHLRLKKSFSSTDPLFPRTRVVNDGMSLCFSANEVEPVFWKTTGSIRSVFKDRAKTAGLRYYSPHCFRHTAVSLAVNSCQTPRQMKAVSQNFGHSNTRMIMEEYGKIESDSVSEIISSLEFHPDQERLSREKIEELRYLINEILGCPSGSVTTDKRTL